MLLPRGDAPRFARRLPLAIIFRAFGAPQPDAALCKAVLNSPSHSTITSAATVPERERFGSEPPASKSRNMLGHSQNHLAVAGGCEAFGPTAIVRLRPHPLPRGGSDCIQQ